MLTVSGKNTYSSWWNITRIKLKSLCEKLDKTASLRHKILSQSSIDIEVFYREIDAAASDYGFFNELFDLETGAVAYNNSEMESFDKLIQADLIVFSDIIEGFTQYDINEYFQGFSKKHQIEKLSERRRVLLQPIQYASLIAYSRLKFSANESKLNGDVDAAVDSLRKVKNELSTWQKDEKLKLQATQEEFDELKIQLENLADVVGVTRQAVFFENAAEEHEDASGWSLLFAIVTAFLLCALAVFSVAPDIEFLKTDNTYDAIQLGLAKVLIFSTLVYLLTQFVKDYNNNRHNAVLNKHRDSALRSYRSLVEATEDETARDVILKEAASCIFSIQPTGYSAPSSDAASGGKINLDIVAKPIIDNAAKALNGKS